jgi:hypothetical protein
MNRETKISNTEIIPQSIWPIAKSLINSHGPRAPPNSSSYRPKMSSVRESQHNGIVLGKLTCIRKTLNGGWSPI